MLMTFLIRSQSLQRSMKKGEKVFAGIGIFIILGAGIMIGYMLFHYDEIKDLGRHRTIEHLNSRK